MLLLNPLTTTITTTLLLLLLHSPPLSATHHHTHRRILHQPLFLSAPSPSLPPSPAPHNHHHHHSLPKLPFTATSTPPPTTSPATIDTDPNPFFPTYPSPPPPLPPPATTIPTTPTTIPTFPANISSLALPTSSPSHSHSTTSKLLIATVITVAVLVVLLASFIILRRRNRRNSSELRPLYPHDTPTSDGRPPLKLPNTHVSHTSSEFLYLGTVAETCEFQVQPTLPVHETSSIPDAVDERVYHIKLCGSNSPELKPLPPLPKHSGSFSLNYNSCEHKFREEEGVSEARREEFFHEEEFFSPSNSSRHELDDEEYHPSPSMNTYDYSPGRDSDVSVEMQEIAERIMVPAAPPPLPPSRMACVGSSSGNVVGPPQLVPPSGPVVLKRSGPLRTSGDQKINEGGVAVGIGGVKPKLKALYWDKVRASSDRVTVWDQLHPGSFQLNEEMIETLFTANGAKDGGARRSILPLLNEEYRVLDPKKSQNIAILLKALSVTEKEVCEALLEGNADALGTELLESLLRMAPTKEEERKLLEYKDESPMKLGPAEKFLRAILDVPFGFKRVDAMLYMTTFDSEVDYLTKSFETLEAASEQLRNNRMFLKLLEAVLKTGNRMNIGTNRGDAEAFKLDTLLKLIDVKGADGKTTLLHFVVQEIIKAEGSRISPTDNGAHKQPVGCDEIELRKLGLRTVASLGGELMSVKKAAAMDADSLSTDVTKLARGITKICEIMKLNETEGMIETNRRFAESMTEFLKKAEMEIVRVQSQGSTAFCKVKELTEYFHGNVAMEEVRPLRIFMVVRDFLGVLDQVCKEVGKINERTTISSVRQFSATVNQNVQPPFPEFRTAGADSSSDNDTEIS